MPIELSELDIRVSLPDIPSRAPVATMPAPCLREHSRAVDGLVKALGLDARGTVYVPHGFAVGGPGGQVEVFAASGAVRARNTDQLAKFEDERRPWADVTEEETDQGVVHRLGDATTERLTAHGLQLLRALGVEHDYASIRMSTGQRALLDESGAELDSGPGRATLQLGYAVEGVKLIGPGAKTNIHFDPDESGERGVIARFFHVNRGVEGSKVVRP